MANRDPETPEQQAARIAGEPQPLSKAVVAAYDSMLATVPDAGGAGFERILEAIARANSVAELDAAWRSEGMQDLAGIPLTIRGISKMPSDFEGGLPWFLVVEAVNEATGEPLTVTTGAVSVVAQLVKAWTMGAFPLRARPVVAERASRSGFHPVHLEILSQPKVNAATQAEDQAAEPATAQA